MNDPLLIKSIIAGIMEDLLFLEIGMFAKSLNKTACVGFEVNLIKNLAWEFESNCSPLL